MQCNEVDLTQQLTHICRHAEKALKYSRLAPDAIDHAYPHVINRHIMNIINNDTIAILCSYHKHMQAGDH